MILAFVAHPDDEVIGPGATLAKLAREEEVEVVVFTYGQSFPPWASREKVVKQRIRETKIACDLLGINASFLGEEDLAIKEDAWEKVKELIEEHSPSRIFTHASFDPHPDHQAVNRAVKRALLELRYSCELYTFETSAWWWWKVKPQLIFDVSKTFKLKAKAMKVFRSQWPILFFLSPLFHLKARYYGKIAGYEYGESFFLE